jgi:hypothetical protein
MNQYLNTIRVIPVVGITRVMMKELAETLSVLDGVFDVIPAKTTDKDGRWNIITDSNHFYTTLKVIRDNLPKWIRTLHTTEEPPAGFPIIRVTAKVTDDNDDESSDGEQSYLSTSALSYGSFQSTGSEDNGPPVDNYYKSTQNQRPRTYASAANATASTRNSHTPRNVQEDGRSSVSAMTSPATLPLEIQIQFQEMETKLKLIPEMESKMQRLELMITQLLSLSMSTTTHPTENSSTTTPSPFTEEHTRPHRNNNAMPAGMDIPSPQRRGSNSPVELFAPNGDGTVVSVGFHRPRTILHKFTATPPDTPPEKRRDETMVKNRLGQNENERAKKNTWDKEEHTHLISNDSSNESYIMKNATHSDPETTAKRNRKDNEKDTRRPNQSSPMRNNSATMGKRNAASPDTKIDPKRKDQRHTPTKADASMDTSPMEEEPFIEVRRHKSRIFNPYKEDFQAKRDNHDAVRQARPKTWAVFEQSRQQTTTTAVLSSNNSLSLPAAEAKRHT